MNLAVGLQVSFSSGSPSQMTLSHCPLTYDHIDIALVVTCVECILTSYWTNVKNIILSFVLYSTET